MSRIDETKPFLPINIAVMTVSDTRTEAEDKSGTVLVERLEGAGHKLAGRILGANDTATAFDTLPFATRPFYFGKPWFLGPVLWWYRWLDARARRPG